MYNAGEIKLSNKHTSDFVLINDFPCTMIEALAMIDPHVGSVLLIEHDPRNSNWKPVLVSAESSAIKSKGRVVG
jgi:hypothetical protein